MSSRYVRFLHNSTKNSSALTNFIRNYSRKVGNDSESPYKHVKPKHPLEGKQISKTLLLTKFT